MNDDTTNINEPDGEDWGEDGEDWGEEPTDVTEEVTATAPTEERPGPRRLTRSSSDRVLVGVAGGLGRYFRVDPVMFRIGFAISVLFGGIGALAYLLLAIFVPTDGEPDRTQRAGTRMRTAGIWRVLGLAVIAIIALFTLLALAGVGAFAVAVGWGVPMAIIVIALGAILALSGLRGGARWLIPPAIALAAGAGVASATDLDFHGGIGDREYHPISANAIPADGYKLGVGRLVVDLRDLPWAKQNVVHVSTHLGAGQANVFVPSRVCVVGTTHVGAGESEVAGERNDGLSVDHSPGGTDSHATPRLVIDASVDAGQLRVINSDTASVDTPGYGPGPFHQDTAPQRAAEASACANG